MLTWTQQRNLYGELTTGTANVANLDFGGRIMNAETRRLVSKMSDHLLHETGTASAVANIQEYELPNKVKKLRGVTFSIGSITQYVRKSPNRRHWDSLNNASSTAYTANFPEWYYHIGSKILYWPTPASASATITYDFDVRFIDSSVADYTTGTISTATNGTTRIAGGSTAWGSAMVGRFLQVDKSNTYANDGDGDYYEISNVVSTTALDLVKNYGGHSIVSGAATYRIGEVSPLPDGYHEVPVYRAAEFYYSKSDEPRADYFRRLANDLESTLSGANDPSDLVTVDDDEDVSENPNNYRRSINS